MFQHTNHVHSMNGLVAKQVIVNMRVIGIVRDEDSQLLPVFPQVEYHHPLLIEPLIGDLRLLRGSHRGSHPREWKHLVAHKCDNQRGLAIIPKSETFFDPFFWILMSEDFTSLAGINQAPQLL